MLLDSLLFVLVPHTHTYPSDVLSQSRTQPKLEHASLSLDFYEAASLQSWASLRYALSSPWVFSLLSCLVLLLICTHGLKMSYDHHNHNHQHTTHHPLFILMNCIALTPMGLSLGLSDSRTSPSLCVFFCVSGCKRKSWACLQTHRLPFLL